MKIIEWLGSIMFLIALIEFGANPRKALQSIPQVLSTNTKVVNGHLTVPHAQVKQKNGEK